MQTRALVFLALAAAASAFTAPAMAGRMQLRSSKSGEALTFFPDVLRSFFDSCCKRSSLTKRMGLPRVLWS